MKLWEAAHIVLHDDEPLSLDEIWRRISARSLVDLTGATPVQSLSAELQRRADGFDGSKAHRGPRHFAHRDGNLWALSEWGREHPPAGPRRRALIANFGVYDVEAAAEELDEDTWGVPSGDLTPGDTFVFWRTLGPDGHRGVVAFGVVTQSPRVMEEPEASHRFWRSNRPEGAHRRVTFRYSPRLGVPLWLDEHPSGVLAELTVSRGQGNKLFMVTEEQWRRLEALARAEQDGPLVEEDDESFLEGKIQYRRHRSRERSARLRKRVLELALAKGPILACQACGMDFQTRYGDVGKGYIEVHHAVPVSSMTEGSKTRPEDMVLLCANCHRMVHRKRPWLTVEALASLVVSSCPPVAPLTKDSP